jgi:site-specific DNA-cytosine methylase
VRPNEKGGTGALWYIDKTFTIAGTQDQFICAMKPIISPTITTCKGSRGGCSDEALEEIKAVHEARQQHPFITKPQPMTTQPLTPQVPLHFLSVCSGMEAASVAWEPLGWKAVGFSEIEPFPCAVLKHRFPNTPNYGSLTEYQSWPLQPGSIDLLVGGTPCQSFSVAGLRKGLADPRGNLALVFLGLADKLKPRWIVWENVSGVLSSDGGRDFGSFLGALEQLGYGWAYRVLDAQYFGVPQRRRRVFVVASLGGRDVAASVLLKPESVCWHPAPRRKKGQATAADAGAGVEAGGRQWPADTACTLNASFGDKQGLEDQHALGGGSLFVPSPIWRAGDQANAEHRIDCAGTISCNRDSQGGFIAMPVVIDRAAFNQGQNAQYEPHIEQTDVMDSLVARGPHAVGVPFRTTHAVVEPTAYILDSYTSNSMKSDNPHSGCREVDAIKCLDTSCLNPSCNQGGVMIAQPIPIQDGREIEKRQNGLGIANQGDPAYTIDTTGAQAIAIQGTIIGRGENAGPQGTGATEGGPMFTLTKTDIHGVCHHMPGSVAPTFTSSGPPYSRTGNERVETEALAITFQPGNLRREAGADPSTTTTTTLKASADDQMPHVAIIAPCITASNDPSRSPQSSEVTQQVAAIHQATMAVRRLTPNECMRLQGFSDNWARIPWKGKPAEQCPDGPQYKCAGNSMAVPVMRWIGEQIARVELSQNQPTA